MVRALAPALDRVVCTELPAEALAAQGRPGAASSSAAELAAALRRGGPAGGGPAGLSPRRCAVPASSPPRLPAGRSS